MYETVDLAQGTKVDSLLRTVTSLQWLNSNTSRPWPDTEKTSLTFWRRPEKEFDSDDDMAPQAEQLSPEGASFPLASQTVSQLYTEREQAKQRAQEAAQIAAENAAALDQVPDAVKKVRPGPYSMEES